MKFNEALVVEANKLAGLLTAIRPYKAFQGVNNIDKLCVLLEAELNKVCGRLMEGQDTRDDA